MYVYRHTTTTISVEVITSMTIFSVEMKNLRITIFFIFCTFAYLAMSNVVLESSIAAKPKHKQWMKDFERTYADDVENETQFKIFAEKLEYIEVQPWWEWDLWVRFESGFRFNLRRVWKRITKSSYLFLILINIASLRPNPKPNNFWRQCLVVVDFYHYWSAYIPNIIKYPFIFLHSKFKFLTQSDSIDHL